MSIIHKVADFAKKMDYASKGIGREDADALELRKYLNTVPMDQLKAATEELYELSERRAYGSVYVEIAKVIHSIHERRRKK